MESYLSSPWNNAVTHLAMAYGDHPLASGSGFFWATKDRVFLVTNWHNFSGRNPLTGRLLSPTGAIPDRVHFNAFEQTVPADANGRSMVRRRVLSMSLCDPDYKNVTWLEHPEYGRGVDVAAIDVTKTVDGLQAQGANIVETDAIIAPETSQEVFVLGFPFGDIFGAPAPIWKRGTIALDPTYNPERLPKILIDTATREGMSGSVVLARHIVVNNSWLQKDGSHSEQMLYAVADVVLGVYSGRHYPDHEKAQLGIVWKRHVIEETVSSGRTASLA